MREALGVMDASASSVPYFIASSFFKQPEACNAEKLFVSEIQGHIGFGWLEILAPGS